MVWSTGCSSVGVTGVVSTGTVSLTTGTVVFSTGVVELSTGAVVLSTGVVELSTGVVPLSVELPPPMTVPLVELDPLPPAVPLVLLVPLLVGGTTTPLWLLHRLHEFWRITAPNLVLIHSAIDSSCSWIPNGLSTAKVAAPSPFSNEVMFPENS